MIEKNAILDGWLFGTALVTGAIAVCWIGVLFVNSGALALSVIAVIGGVYTIGAGELIKFRHATATLSRALGTVHEGVGDLDAWLERIDPAIRNAVRSRVEGERNGLPAPMLTPYLAGLLVMLGLLGTFVGMVDTLRGAVAAIEGTMELQAIRDGLAAPIKGLGLAFGTSVAGVAASAMLGLMSTICRRRRMLETLRLDSMMPTVFRDHSLVQRQRETFSALRLQTEALPRVVDKLDAMADQLGRLGGSLLENQDRYHTSVKENFSLLADSVDKTFRVNLKDTQKMVDRAIKPMVEENLAGLAREAQKIHQSLTSATRENIETTSRLFADQLEEMAGSWQAGLEAHHDAAGQLMEQMGRRAEAFEEKIHQMTEQAASQLQNETSRLVQSSQELIRSRIETETAWLEGHQQRMDALGASLRADLGALRDDEAQRGKAAVARLEKLESVLATHLATLGQALEEPMAKLMETASESPRAAAQVIEHLRQAAADHIQQENRLLGEHRQVLEQIDALSAALSNQTSEQRATIERMAADATKVLEDVGLSFGEQVDKKISDFGQVAENAAGSAAEVASLGEAFGVAVDLFVRSNEKLIENLGQVEASLDKAAARSDDQLGYYVAQARDMIDHSILSHKEILEALRAVHRPDDAPSEVDQCKG